MTTAVYLDATIPSFYFEERPGTILQAWREITAAFWEYAAGRYDLWCVPLRCTPILVAV